MRICIHDADDPARIREEPAIAAKRGVLLVNPGRAEQATHLHGLATQTPPAHVIVRTSAKECLFRPVTATVRLE